MKLTAVILLLLLSGAIGLGEPPAFAQDEELPPVAAGDLEIYQANLVEGALTHHKLRTETSPQGKTIERIVIVPYNVFTEGDPWPEWVQIVHSKTKPEVVRRELLFQKGEKWNQELVDETERNLREYLPLAMARIVPARGSAPDRIVVLVVTKDIWSLRLNWDISYVDSRVELLSLELQETNLGGWDRTIGATYRHDLATNTMGLEFLEPRLVGSRVSVRGSGAVIYNHESGAYEGGIETLSVGQPLYSLESEWAWRALAHHRKDVYRLFSAGGVAVVTDPATGQSLPYSFHRNGWNAEASATRSFGRDVKQDLSFGWRIYSSSYNPPDLATPVSVQTLTDFQNAVVPRSEQAGLLFAGYHFYTPRYVKLEDIQTFALTEDYQLGPDLQFEGRFANPAFGFSSRYFEARSDLAYRWWQGNDLLTAGSALQARHQNDVIAGTSWVNELASLRLSNVSPRFSIFRLHAQGQLVRRSDDLGRNVETLGGDSLLRGYPSAFFVGPNLWSANFELRTLPLEFHTVYLGLAGFIDTGDAYYGLSTVSLHASTGGGLRILFPQFNRSVLRIDVGIPLETAPGVSPVSVVAQFGQVIL